MKKYWDQVEIGEKLPEIKKTAITRVQIAKFAALTNDFSPLHLDEIFAKSVGFGSVHVHGLLSLGLANEALRNFATNITIFSLTGTFLRLVWPGDSLIAKGMVVKRFTKGEENRIGLRIWCENQKNEIVMKGSSLCLLFKNENDEKISQSEKPIINDATKERLYKKWNGVLHPKALTEEMARAPENT
jgi:acyl dehydratase